jgi:uncharacterized protein YkwD
VLGVLLAVPTVASAKLTWKQALLVQINTYRVHNHRATLHFNTRLSTSAQAHSNNMARYRLFSHTSSKNLAVGQFTPSGAFHAWYYSAPHRANLLSTPYRSVGLGRTVGHYNGRWASYITADFGGYL